ncbi:toll/interleukin-1 receptor domain-containing protein [Nonomuraea sp. H19]|uniref:toll/interleukin-1 receptor domain-containing protein n=1 Tax=Nonomuraea sp. H19 TaxID=3452206 RepID=UPI003F8A7EBA
MIQEWIAAVAAVIAIVPLCAAWLTRLRRTPPSQPAGERYDLFISYVKPDAAAARRLARRLSTVHGLTVFFDEWSVGPGVVRLIAKGEAIEGTAHGALLFSRSSVGDAELMDDYAALLTQVYNGSARFIPVRLDDAKLPPFAAIRQGIDLRRRYNAEVARLADAVAQRR